MIKKMAKPALLCVLAIFLIAVAGWYSARYISTQKAQKKLDVLLKAGAFPDSEEEKVIAISKKVFKTFQEANPAYISAYKIRPYITNKRLPEFIRFPEGIIETNIQKGLCDNASRMLAFALKQEGLSSKQWNMMTHTGGHSARFVTLSNGTNVFVDPFYGVAAIDMDGHLTSLTEARDRVLTGEPPENVLMTFSEKSKTGFYDNLATMFMAAEGEELVIDVTLPRINETITLGQIDGQSNDVKSAGSRTKITPYWHYIGHQYNREWVRVLEAPQPLKLVMTLVEEPDENVLVSADPAPQVKGKTLTWMLEEGEKLTFRDGLAEISLKRLNSYIPVDRIEMIPADTE